MSIRITFYQADGLGASVLARVARGMRAEAFSRGGNSGFLIEKSNAHTVLGRYVERFPISEVVIDPFGVETSFERFDFKVVSFELRTQPECLVVYNSSSLIKNLSGRLAEFSDFSVSLVTKSLALSKIVKEFSSEFSNSRVYAACVDGYSLSNTTSVKMSFESSEDVRPHILRFIKTKGISYSSLKMEFEAFGLTRRCEIKHSGAVTIFGENDPALTNKISSIILRTE